MSKEEKKLQVLVAEYDAYLDEVEGDHAVTEGAGADEGKGAIPKRLDNTAVPDKQVDSEDEVNEDALVTRHNKYPRCKPSSPPPSPPSSRKPPASPTPTSMNPTNQHAPGLPPQHSSVSGALGATPAAIQTGATIKVMPSEASVREFTATDDDYSARDFVTLCENTMRNSSVTSDVDKIAFVSSRIKQGSEASRRMRVSALTRSIRNGDYDGFKQRFMKVFGENVKHSLVKGVHLAVEKIMTGINALGIDEAQIDAGCVSEDLVRYLRDNHWGTADDMTWENVTQFIEFFVYMLLLKGKLRSGSQEIVFSAGDELIDFALKPKAKRDVTRGETALIAPLTEASHVTSGVAALRLNSPSRPDTTNTTPAVTCSYCNKLGHNKNHCFARLREKKKRQDRGVVSPDYTPASPRQQSLADKRQARADPMQRPPQRSYASTTRPLSPRSRGATGETPFCHLHQTTTHFTSDCLALAQIRRDRQAQGNCRVGTTSSGEAARPMKTEPP